jgi:hypothetical protein
MITRFATSLILALTIFVIGCARPTTIQTPEAKRAYDANEVVKRINEFQAATIEASDTQQIPVATARTIVQWCVASLEALKGAPQGWDEVLRRSWQQVKPEVEKLPKLSHWAIVVDALLGVV